MAVAKKQIYIEAELQWLEDRLAEWKTYIEANPYNEVKDRLSFKETKNGGMIPMVVASVEQQQKSLRDTAKEMFALLGQINEFRETEIKKIETRGKSEMSAMAEEWITKK